MVVIWDKVVPMEFVSMYVFGCTCVTACDI